MSHEFEILDERIRQLESNNRRLKWLGVALGALLLATTAWGQTARNAVAQAQKFELRDDKGRLRAELSILEGGKSDEGAALRFFDADGDVESLLNGSVFTILKKRGDNQAVFRKNGLSFGDGRDKTFVTLDAYEEEQVGKLQLNDYRNGTHITVAPKDLAKLLEHKSQ
jgi:hypothetical protein